MLARDGDNTVLYAHEPNTAYFNNEGVHSETSQKEAQEIATLDVLAYYCQVIDDAIQNLDKKVDDVHTMLYKINHSCVKSIWLNRMSLRYAHRCYNYLLPRKMKLRKQRRRASYCAFSDTASYIPTSPVRREENDFSSNVVVPSLQSKEICEQDPELISVALNKMQEEHEDVQWEWKWMVDLKQSESFDDPSQDSSLQPWFPSPGANSTDRLSPSLKDPTVVSVAQPVQATSAPVRAGSDMPKQSFPDDPESWSVEEVILFLNQKDPEISGPLADLFRQHNIDGKALLLLKSDMLIKDLGIKLGTAVKLGHYIEKLKEEKHLGS